MKEESSNCVDDDDYDEYGCDDDDGDNDDDEDEEEDEDENCSIGWVANDNENARKIVDGNDVNYDDDDEENDQVNQEIVSEKLVDGKSVDDDNDDDDFSENVNENALPANAAEPLPVDEICGPKKTFHVKIKQKAEREGGKIEDDDRGCGRAKIGKDAGEEEEENGFAENGFGGGFEDGGFQLAPGGDGGGEKGGGGGRGGGRGGKGDDGWEGRGRYAEKRVKKAVVVDNDSSAKTAAEAAAAATAAHASSPAGSVPVRVSTDAADEEDFTLDVSMTQKIEEQTSEFG